MLPQTVPDGALGEARKGHRRGVGQYHGRQGLRIAPVQDGEEQLPGVFRPMHLVGLVDDQQIEGGEAGDDLLLTLSGGGVPGGANLGEDLLRGLQQGVFSGVGKDPAQGVTQMRFAGARSAVEDRGQGTVAAQPVG